MNGHEMLLGNTREMKILWQMAKRAAPTDVTIVVCGESGTGKELLAREICNLSLRSRERFVAVNCGGLNEALLESELFGHERGSFTGAFARKIGLFEEADGGTLFLDEVGEVSAAMQVKLLRVLQSGEFRRVGGDKVLTTNVRIIAATNRDLEAALRDGKFREDLYYRLSVITLQLPPLRDRVRDIPDLVHHFMTAANRQMRRDVMKVSPEVLSAFERYPWPGNIRELGNVIERAVVLAEGDTITLGEIDTKIQIIGRADLPALDDRALAQFPPLPIGGLNLNEALNAYEKSLIEQALARTHGLTTNAAKMLGINRTTLVEKRRKYDLL